MSNHACTCSARHPLRRVVVTGGPGAGKTALLETVRRHFCAHVQVLHESAGILFAGGFPRLATAAGCRSAQRAIFHVQRELEELALEEPSALTLCDRGTLDALAYWPDPPSTFFAALDTTLEAELARYAAVVHLRVPPKEHYNHQNVLRIESAREAARIDVRISEVWSRHPRYTAVESSDDFLSKVNAGLHVLRGELPECCQLAATPAPRHG